MMCESSTISRISSGDHVKDSNFPLEYIPLKSPSCQDPSSSSGKTNQVSSVSLFGVHIVSLVMEGKERLCLAQISSTLLKEFSYNEIHNRRVALGITCIQCTPVQLEILRRAGAMPVTSRRCGMITRREAERLCQSFLGDHAPPQLPDNFSFEVYHECAWGCRGAFVPSRYNSSRAKCIRCSFCQLFFSPNKFIFHSHRLPNSNYTQPDAANFNSWRRHLKLCGDPPEDISSSSHSPQTHFSSLNSSFSPSSTNSLPTSQIVHAWEDVKAMFNGGTRKRLLAAHITPSISSYKKNSSKGVQHDQNPVVNESKETKEKLSNLASSSSTTNAHLSSPTGSKIESFWNPGVNERINEDGNVPLLPLSIHPLTLPWLRRPLFPFSHPFTTGNCKYFGESASIGPHLNKLQMSAFRPVLNQNITSSPLASDSIYSSWFQNTKIHGNLPEDLSLSSTSSLLLLHSQSVDEIGNEMRGKFESKFENKGKNNDEYGAYSCSSSSCEENVDIESTSTEIENSGEFLNGEKRGIVDLDSSQKRMKKFKCEVEENEEIELDIESDEEIKTPFIKTNLSGLLKSKLNKTKKRLWD